MRRIASRGISVSRLGECVELLEDLFAAPGQTGNFYDISLFTLPGFGSTFRLALNRTLVRLQKRAAQWASLHPESERAHVPAVTGLGVVEHRNPHVGAVAECDIVRRAGVERPLHLEVPQTVAPPAHGGNVGAVALDRPPDHDTRNHRAVGKGCVELDE